MHLIYIIISLLLAIDNIFIKYKVAGISYDRLLEFFFFFVFFKTYLKELHTNPFFRKWNIFIVILAIIQLLANLKMGIEGAIEFKVIYTSFIKCFSFIVFSFLFLLVAKKNIRYVNIIVSIHLLICLFAFLQHPISPWAGQMLEIKKLLYAIENTDDKVFGALSREETYISGGFADRFRLAGPFSSTISFAYFALSSFIINFYLYLRYKKTYYLALLIILFLASILTQTRSLLLAEICLVFGYLFFAPHRRHAIYKMTIIIGALFSLIVIYSYRNIITDEDSRMASLNSGGETDVRPLLWTTAIYAVLKNPFGLSQEDYQEARVEMFREFGHPGILFLMPHHGVINIGFNYTFFGYIIFLWFTLYFLNYINFLDPKIKVFFRLAIISYIIHTSFHNNFVLDSDYPFVMVIMLVLIDNHYFKRPEQFYQLNITQ